MLSLVAERKSEIERICRRHRVRRLTLVGSGARQGDFDPSRSDLDFLVTFDESDGPTSLRRYFDLRQELGRLLERPIDLIMEGSVRNPFVRRSMLEGGEAVFAA